MLIKLHLSFAVDPGAWPRVDMAVPTALSVTDGAARLRVMQQAMSNLLGDRASLSAHLAAVAYLPSGRW